MFDLGCSISLRGCIAIIVRAKFTAAHFRRWTSKGPEKSYGLPIDYKYRPTGHQAAAQEMLKACSSAAKLVVILAISILHPPPHHLVLFPAVKYWHGGCYQPGPGILRSLAPSSWIRNMLGCYAAILKSEHCYQPLVFWNTQLDQKHAWLLCSYIEIGALCPWE